MSSSLGKLVIVSGPSGAGKTTVLQRLLEKSSLPLTLSVSATTRPPRPGEKDGVAYHFLPDKEFQERRTAGDFLECMEVFGSGYWYGTLAETVTTSLRAGKWVVLEIDVEGALAVLQKYTDAVTIFLHPGSLDELERRLRGRGTESEEKIRKRLEVAKRELTFIDRYRHDVTNDDLEQAVEELSKILGGYQTNE